jgi:hypothetical protein
MSKLRCAVLHRIFVLALLVLLPAGCAIIPVPTRSARVGGSDALGSCADFFADLDRRAAHAQVLDSGAFRVEGYPYLRVNRFLASFRRQVGDQAAFAAWVDQMQALDQDARKYEIANLLQATGSTPGPANDQDEIYDKVDSCGNLLKATDLKDSQSQEVLRERQRRPMSTCRCRGFWASTR